MVGSRGPHLVVEDLLDRAHGPVNQTQAILATDSEWLGITLHSLLPRLPLLRKTEDNLPNNVIKSIKLQGDRPSSVWYSPDTEGPGSGIGWRNGSESRSKVF